MALSFGGVAMAFALVAGLYIGERQAEELRDQTGSALRQFAFLAGSDIARSIDERHDDLMFASSLRSFRDTSGDEGSRNRQREHFTDLQRWHPEFVWMGFSDLTGQVQSATGRMLEESDVSGREWFVKGLSKSYFGDVHDAILLRPLLPQARGQAALLIDVSTPVVGLDGSLRGVIGAHLSDAWLRGRLVALKRGSPALQSVEILLLSKDGTLLVSSDAVAGERGDILRGDWLGASAGGHVMAAMEGGREYLAGFHRVLPHGDFRGFGWIVIARQDAALALASSAHAREAALLFLAILGLAFTALGWVIAGRIGRPLEEITSAATRLGAGEAVEVPGAERADEIGSLAAALSGLVANLKKDEALIREREAELENIVETMVEGVATYDADGRITRVNAAAERILGAKRSEIVGCHFTDVPWQRVLADGNVLADDLHPFMRVLNGEGRIEGMEFDIVTAQGRRTTIQLSAAPIRDAGAFSGMVATYADISERKLAEATTRRAQERLDRALEASKIALFEVDVRSGITYLSESWSLMRGGPAVPTETTVAKLLELTHPEDRDRLWALAKSSISGTYGVYEAEHRVRDEAGEWIWIISRARVVERDAQGLAQRLSGTNVDVTERKRAEQRIHYLNTRDGLTDLSNRALFADRLEGVVADAGRGSRRLALLAIGLDRFTAINDSLGRDFGDEVLKAAAGRISASVGVEDVVARPGGDEFLVLLERVDTHEDARRAAEAMRAAVATTMHLSGRETVVTASVGIALFPADGDSAGVLLRNAGTALTAAKEAGGDGVHFFAPQMNIVARTRFETEAELRRALERDEFVLHFQPQIDLTTGAIVGWEALVRWRHPERGLVPPGHFLPIAEMSGLIVPLGEHVMLKACRQAASWKQAGMQSARVAINVSAQQFRHPTFMKSVRSAFASTGLDPRLLEMEIVESVLIGHEPLIDSVFAQLGAMGVELAIDDFGTGYSSLSYLKRLPIDTVKIDQSFVRDVPSSPEACAIVTAVIAMAHGLGLKVIAEGIEHPSQLDFLRQGGCDRGQGFLFGRPEPPEHWSRTGGNVLPLKRPEASPSSRG